MLILLKSLHFLALAIAGSGSLAVVIIQRHLRRKRKKLRKGDPIHYSIRVLMLISMFATLAICFSGAGLLFLAPKSEPTGVSHVVKLSASTTVLALIGWQFALYIRAARLNRQVSKKRIRRVNVSIRVFLAVAIISAVAAHSPTTI